MIHLTRAELRMRSVSMQCWLAKLLVIVILVGVAGNGATAQTDDLTSLNRRVSELYSAGKSGEAIPLAERSLELTRALKGEDHLDTADRIGWLADLYGIQGRYAEAELLHKRSLSIREQALGPDHPSVGISLNNLAGLYQYQGRYADAEPLYKRSLGIREKALGPDHPSVGVSVNNLAALYHAQGRYTEAEPLYQRSLALREKALGPDHLDVGNSINNLAVLYERESRYVEAEHLKKRALAIREKALGPNHPEVAMALNNLAFNYANQGRYADAEPLYKRALNIGENVLSPNNRNLGTWLNNLAGLYQTQGRYAEAEPLFRRSLSIAEEVLGPEHSEVGQSLNYLALLCVRQGRYAEAERHFRRSSSVLEKALGANHDEVGSTLNNFALLYLHQGRHAEAEPLLKRSLAIRGVLGPNHPVVATSLNNLAGVYKSQGNYGLAESLYQRALTIWENALGPSHTAVGSALGNLAGLYLVQRDWPRAADAWRRSTALTVRRAQLGAVVAGAPLGKAKSEADQLGYRFVGLVKVVHRLAETLGSDAGLPALGEGREARETFATAQWAKGSEAANSLAQMAARGAKGDPNLSWMVRERQDLVVEWQRRDGVQTAAMSQAPDKRDRAAEAANVVRLAAIEARISEIDQRLGAEFPDYAALSSPQPLTIEEVQADLRRDEALVLFLDTPEWKPTKEETFIWVVTKSDVRWVRSGLGTPALTREVAALRCGLDATAWTGANCRDLTGKAYTDADRDSGKQLPFDHARAHKLYTALFGEITDLIKGKHLLLVPSGPLTQLPFQVLVTEPPKGDDHQSIRWLAREHALTVLPAVSSLKALRRVAKPSAATLPMIGFGNPLLDGPDPSHMKRAQQARDRQRCQETVGDRVVSLLGLRGGIAPIVTRGGLLDVSKIKATSPLPETTDELCAVARDLKADVREMRLGERATEREIKALSSSGKLAQYRILHFATHGALSGQLTGTNEPGLILTPPEAASEEDDGYLSGGEIAGLKLDADWVILSACNTAGAAVAADDPHGAEALSGLARAFFYAGARALLVSHWEIHSNAAVKLITSAVGAISNNTSIGRAEALRRAMLAMIDQGKPHEAHPAYWAPFAVVGEGSVPAPVVPISPESVSITTAPLEQAVTTPRAKATTAQKRSSKPRRPSAQIAPDDWTATVFPR